MPPFMPLLKTSTPSLLFSKILSDKILINSNFFNCNFNFSATSKALKYDLVTNAKKSLDAGCNLVLYCAGNINDNFKLIKSVPFIDNFTYKKTSEIYKILR